MAGEWIRIGLCVLCVSAVGPGIVGTAAAGAASASGRLAGKLNNISGLAPAGDGAVLAVADTKRGSDAVRFALLSTGDGSRLDLDVDWPAGLQTHDLEALCAVPGRVDEYLAFESGRVDEGEDGGGSSVYRVWLDRGGDTPTLRFVQRLWIPAETRGRLDDDAFDQIEGAASWLAGESIMVAVGMRVAGDLVLLELVGDGFEVVGRQTTAHQACERDRRIGDLCVDERDGDRVLYGVQADDPGDFGPFGSTIVVIGTIGKDGELAVEPEAIVAAVCEGLKIEGVCAPAGESAGVLIAGTDDEGFVPALRAVRVR